MDLQKSSSIYNSSRLVSSVGTTSSFPSVGLAYVRDSPCHAVPCHAMPYHTIPVGDFLPLTRSLIQVVGKIFPMLSRSSRRTAHAYLMDRVVSPVRCLAAPKLPASVSNRSSSIQHKLVIPLLMLRWSRTLRVPISRHLIHTLNSSSSSIPRFIILRSWRRNIRRRHRTGSRSSHIVSSSVRLVSALVTHASLWWRRRHDVSAVTGRIAFGRQLLWFRVFGDVGQGASVHDAEFAGSGVVDVGRTAWGVCGWFDAVVAVAAAEAVHAGGVAHRGRVLSWRETIASAEFTDRSLGVAVIAHCDGHSIGFLSVLAVRVHVDHAAFVRINSVGCRRLVLFLPLPEQKCAKGAGKYQDW